MNNMYHLVFWRCTFLNGRGDPNVLSVGDEPYNMEYWFFKTGFKTEKNSSSTVHGLQNLHTSSSVTRGNS